MTATGEIGEFTSPANTKGEDIRIGIRKDYSQVLTQRGLILTKIDEKTAEQVQSTTHQFKEYISKKAKSDFTQAEIYQSTAVYTIYLGQIYNLLHDIHSEDQSIVQLKDSFSTFENFAKTYLKDLQPEQRSLLRELIGLYNLSVTYEPKGTGEQTFIKVPGYWHSTGSTVLEQLSEEGLLSPREALERGKLIKTGEYVTGNYPFGNPQYEDSLVNGIPIDPKTVENRIYLNEDRSLNNKPRFSDRYTGNSIPWFNQYPVDIFINYAKLSQTNPHFVHSPGATSMIETCVEGRILPETITDIFVPMNQMKAPAVEVLKMKGFGVHARENYGSRPQKTINIDSELEDAFTTPK